jgi:hypothetical protein
MYPQQLLRQSISDNIDFIISQTNEPEMNLQQPYTYSSSLTAAAGAIVPTSTMLHQASLHNSQTNRPEMHLQQLPYNNSLTATSAIVPTSTMLHQASLYSSQTNRPEMNLQQPYSNYSMLQQSIQALCNYQTNFFALSQQQIHSSYNPLIGFFTSTSMPQQQIPTSSTDFIASVIPQQQIQNISNPSTHDNQEDEFEDEAIELSNNPNKSKSPKAIWGKEDTDALLSFAEKHPKDIYDLSKNRKHDLKESIWNKASNILNGKFTSVQCAIKWKNLKSNCKVNYFFSIKIKF